MRFAALPVSNNGRKAWAWRAMCWPHGLKSLVAHGIFEAKVYCDRPKRHDMC
ncbi:MAG: hypothetical protein WDN06_08495 [Asticcacaulis sp.]